MQGSPLPRVRGAQPRIRFRSARCYAEPHVQPLLEVKELRTSFFTEAGEVRAVDGVSFSVEPGKLMGMVGESGSGKTASVLSIMRLLPESRAHHRRRGTVRGSRPAEAERARDAPRTRREDRDDLPGADDLAQPGLHDRQPDRRGRPAASADRSRARRATARSRRCGWSESPTPSAASTTIRISSPAGCASG